jgi:hypothetical protein
MTIEDKKKKELTSVLLASSAPCCINERATTARMLGMDCKCVHLNGPQWSKVWVSEQHIVG